MGEERKEIESVRFKGCPQMGSEAASLRFKVQSSMFSPQIIEISTDFLNYIWIIRQLKLPIILKPLALIIC